MIKPPDGGPMDTTSNVCNYPSCYCPFDMGASEKCFRGYLRQLCEITTMPTNSQEKRDIVNETIIEALQAATATASHVLSQLDGIEKNSVETMQLVQVNDALDTLDELLYIANNRVLLPDKAEKGTIAFLRRMFSDIGDMSR